MLGHKLLSNPESLLILNKEFNLNENTIITLARHFFMLNKQNRLLVNTLIKTLHENQYNHTGNKTD